MTSVRCVSSVTHNIMPIISCLPFQIDSNLYYQACSSAFNGYSFTLKFRLRHFIRNYYTTALEKNSHLRPQRICISMRRTIQKKKKLTQRNRIMLIMFNYMWRNKQKTKINQALNYRYTKMSLVGVVPPEGGLMTCLLNIKFFISS